MGSNTFNISVTGLSETISKFKITGDKIDRELNKELYRQIQKLKNDIYRSMQSTQKGSGKNKYIGRDGRYHKPSKPGFPPAIASGNLIKSMISKFNFSNKSAVVTFNDEGYYINYLENGTNKMEARPSVFPAAERLTVAKDVGNLLQRIINENW